MAGREKMKKKPKIIPLTEQCQMCSKKVTDHHWFCNKCWSKRQKITLKRDEAKKERKKIKNKIMRYTKKLKILENDYKLTLERHKGWGYIT